VLAIAEPFLDHLVAADRVVPNARDKRRPLANEILPGGFENQFSRAITAHYSNYSPLVNPLGHLSPSGSLANLAALYPFNGLPDLHRHLKLAIILGLSEGGQSASSPNSKTNRLARQRTSLFGSLNFSTIGPIDLASFQRIVTSLLLSHRSTCAHCTLCVKSVLILVELPGLRLKFEDSVRWSTLMRNVEWSRTLPGSSIRIIQAKYDNSFLEECPIICGRHLALTLWNGGR